MSYRGHRVNAQRKQKRPNDTNGSGIEDNSPVIKLFKTYQTELDARYDKYERLVKKSRDLTIESKRVIFLLHRVSRRRREVGDPDHFQGILPQKWGGNKPNRIVTCMVIKATAIDRRTSSPLPR
ncbi:translin-associated protein X [Trichonephila clavipes]|nr:translin-associated protein X [Trichonephila clavipes]